MSKSKGKKLMETLEQIGAEAQWSGPNIIVSFKNSNETSAKITSIKNERGEIDIRNFGFKVNYDQTIRTVFISPL